MIGERIGVVSGALLLGLLASVAALADEETLADRLNPLITTVGPDIEAVAIDDEELGQRGAGAMVLRRADGKNQVLEAPDSSIGAFNAPHVAIVTPPFRPGVDKALVGDRLMDTSSWVSH